MKNSRTLKLIIFAVLPVLILTSGACARAEGWDAADQILKRVVPPDFPDREYNIVSFGAVADSVTDCTESIRAAIKKCSDDGGGRVIIPEGVYLTGAIHLKSNVNLNLLKNATLLFIRDPNNYLPAVHTRFEGYDLMNYSPFIYAKDVENIAITGDGVLDGNADTAHWWPWKGNSGSDEIEGISNQNSDRRALGEMAKKNIPYEQRVFGQNHFLRPNFIQFIQSENILIDGITIINSPMWEIHPVLCSNITVKGVKVISHGPNNDGCNPESCRDVLIEDCLFDTGDDCIAIKSGREEDGRRVNAPSENIIVRNCEMKDGHGGVVIGSEISGGCRNVFIENCTMDSPNLERALRIKSNSLRGGVVENIYMRNVTVGQVKESILHINFFYEEGDIGDFSPVVKNIYIDHVTSEESQYALWIKGYERSPVTGIYISDCRFNGVLKGNIISEVNDLNIKKSFMNDEKFTEGNSVNNHPQMEEINKTNP